jgi:hypothetical protein
MAILIVKEHVECLSVHKCAILRLIQRLIFETLVGVYGLRIAHGLSYEIGQGLYEPHARVRQTLSFELFKIVAKRCRP